jgi:large subunit ribosomal protein L25
MQTIKVTADSRTNTGKEAAARLRAKGQIPAVAYGPGKPTVSIAVSPKAITQVLGAEHGKNTLIELDVSGKEKLTVLLADYQYHPVTRTLLHADFREVKENEPADFEVPFETTGKAKGVVDGGVLRLVYRKLPVRCLPAKVPVKITHDITELGLEESIPVKALALPEGVTVRLPADQTVVTVATEKKQVEEAAAPGAPGAAAAAPAAGAAGAAPAAGAAAPAAGAKPGAGAKPSK